jgi:hypothetical protein
LIKIRAAAMVWEMGSATVGSGPQRLGRSASHHPIDAATQTLLLSWIARSAFRRRSAPAAATAASSAKNAGKTARTAPLDVATPLPPRNRFQAGQM